jgi:class 3 adenylate cyclase/CHASE2 domain-containing sensor protein
MEQKKTLITNIALFVGVFVIFSLLIYFNALSGARSTITDGLYAEKPLLDNIIIVEIDDASINSIGRWPWDRSVFAALLNKTSEAKVIGMDLSFFEPSDNDTLLIEQLSTMDNVVLASEINQGTLFEPIFDAEIGYVNLRTSNDGVTRKIRFGLSEEVLPFSFQIYQKAWKPNAIFEKKDYVVNFGSEPGGFNSYSAQEVLDGEIDFKDKIVLMGATAPNLHDNYFVPTSAGIPMPGVEIHGHILQNLILDDFLNEQGKIGLMIVLLIIGGLCFFLLSKLKIYWVIPIAIVGAATYALISIFAFNKFNYIMDFFYVPIGLLVFTGVGFGSRYMEQQKHNAFIKGAFGKYISKDLMHEIVEQKRELKLGGDKREVTVFFSDIRGFTPISEKLAPEELVHLLNEYLTEMTDLVMKYDGTVDKFIGDAVMALWNAPLTQKEHAELACKSAIEQIKKLRELKEKWESEGLPPIDIGIGINTGSAIVGNMGSEDRFDYTAIGDTVNLAARLESLNKEKGTNIIISQSTYDLVKDKFKTKPLGEVKVKGKSKAVKVYELIAES